jgi:hypothetical protein
VNSDYEAKLIQSVRERVIALWAERRLVFGPDRAIAIPTRDGYMVAIADGAGGTGSGGAGAEGLIVAITKLADATRRDQLDDSSLL